jgi:hypothetical protein
MTDQELLELAAKAAGLTSVGADDAGLYPSGMTGPWNPLTDDGDALRLAVKLRIDIEFSGTAGGKTYASNYAAPSDLVPCSERHAEDASAATRRAIVRAAAATVRQA